MRLILRGAAALALMVPVAANAMSVADFLVKARALEGKGMMAMFSPDLKVVMAEFKTAGPAYRADVQKARAEGRTDLGCPPTQGKLGINSKQVMAEFSAIPAAQQKTMTVRQAFYAMMAKRFPCKS